MTSCQFPSCKQVLSGRVLGTRNTCCNKPLARPYALCACRIKRQSVLIMIQE